MENLYKHHADVHIYIHNTLNKVCWAVISCWFCLVYLQKFYFVLFDFVVVKHCLLLLFVVWPELLKCYFDIIMVNSSKCEYDVMISPLNILFLSCVYVSVTVHWVALTYDFIVILQSFYVIFIRIKKKATSLPVSYCLLSLIVDRSILKLRHNIYRNRFPRTVYLVLSTPLPSADYLWIWWEYKQKALRCKVILRCCAHLLEQDTRHTPKCRRRCSFPAAEILICF